MEVIKVKMYEMQRNSAFVKESIGNLSFAKESYKRTLVLLL